MPPLPLIFPIHPHIFFFTSDNEEMKSLTGFTLITLLLNSGCKQSGTESVSSGSPNIQPGACYIGKWTNLSTPLSLKMSSEFSSDFTGADLVGGLNPIEQMAKAWNDSVAPTVSLFQLPFGTAGTTGSSNLTSFRDGEMGIYKSHTWFSNVSANALAITQFYGIVRSDGNLGTYVDLTHADIIVNYRDFGSDFTMTGNPMIDYDLPTIVLHEMGHFLGFCHESYANSIMAPYYFTTQRNLKTFDINKTRALYLNNQNYTAFSSKTNSKTNAINTPVGTEVKGIIELSSNGHCRHFINGKLISEHD